MLLAIDVGNTNTGFAVFDDTGHMQQSWRLATDMRRTGDEYASWLLPLLTLHKLSFQDISAVIIASVVPDARFNLTRFCKIYCDCVPRFIDAAMMQDVGLNINIDKPQEAGADRLVNALAVQEKYGFPAILVDFGTATNLDILDEEGHFIGGVIAPGIGLSCDALYNASAKLPRIDIHAPDQAIGRNTIDAMRSGIFYGYVSLIEGLIARCRGELSGDVKIVATGGLADVFDEHLPSLQFVDQDITTYGLFLLHQHLQKKSV